MRKKDRRENRTKRMLEMGLIQLMEQKKIKNITVCELTELVDLNRSTFYRYYRDVYDMVEHLEERLIHEVTDALESEAACDDIAMETYRITRTILHCVERNADLVRVLWSERGDIAFVKLIEDYMEEQAELLIREKGQHTLSDEQVQLVGAYFVSGSVGMIRKWLAMEHKPDIETLLELIFSLIGGGVSGGFIQLEK